MTQGRLLSIEEMKAAGVSANVAEVLHKKQLEVAPKEKTYKSNMIEQKDIVDYAKKEGYKITPRMLRYWQSSGLIPQPEIQFPGRGKGSKSLYPDGTDKQALVICKLPLNRRSVVEVGWSMWRSDFSVSPEVAKGVLRNELESLRCFVAIILDESGRLSDYAFDIFISPEDAEDTQKKHSRKELYQPHGILRSMSKKLSAKKYFPTLKYLLSLAYALPTDTYDYDPKFRSEDCEVNKKVFSAALGELLPPGKLPPVFVPYPGLAEMRKLANPANLEECLREASDATLRTAYQEIGSAYNSQWKVYFILRVIHEGKLPHKNVEFEKLPANEQAFWLLLWLAFRRNTELYQGYKQLSKWVSELWEGRLPAEELFT